MLKKTVFAAFLMQFMVACAPVDDVASTPEDPYEPFNRQVFAFNEVVDTMILKPVSSVYRFILPEVAQTGVSNALNNFYEPVTMINALLQFDGDRAFTSFWRFVLNTTLGFGGVYDWAGDNSDLKYRSEDFGQTLGVWASDTDSAYLVLPILGPSTTRDAFGRVVDVGLNPWTWALKPGESIGIAVTKGVSDRAEANQLIDDVYETSLDPYATFRSGYLQRRKAQILNTHNPKDQAYPNID